jgi:hypothetical protein
VEVEVLIGRVRSNWDKVRWRRRERKIRYFGGFITGIIYVIFKKIDAMHIINYYRHICLLKS